MRLGDLDNVVDFIQSYKVGRIAKSELLWALSQQPTIDAVPVEMVVQMFFDFTGDLCPCNFNDNDEWLPEVCELLNECPNPKGDKLACWKQYIKHFQPRKDGDNA